MYLRVCIHWNIVRQCTKKFEFKTENKKTEKKVEAEAERKERYTGTTKQCSIVVFFSCFRCCHMSNPVVPTPHSRQWTRVVWGNGRANAKGRKRRGKQQNKHARKRQRKGSVQRSLWVALTGQQAVVKGDPSWVRLLVQFVPQVFCCCKYTSFENQLDRQPRHHVSFKISCGSKQEEAMKCVANPK